MPNRGCEKVVELNPRGGVGIVTQDKSKSANHSSLTPLISLENALALRLETLYFARERLFLNLQLDDQMLHMFQIGSKLTLLKPLLGPEWQDTCLCMLHLYL